MKNFIALTLFLVLSNLSYGEQPSNEFVQMQKVLGKWEGTLIRSAESDIPITLEYKLISNGCAIVEHSNEDGVEMMTTFIDDKGKLFATHYCGLGNQPRMSVSGRTKSSVSFMTDLGKSGLVASEDQFVNTWTFGDMETGTETFTYTYTVSNPDKTTETNQAVMRRVN